MNAVLNPTDLASLPAPAPIQQLHHYAYKARDAEETRQFYEDILGLHDGDPAPLPTDTLQPGTLVCEAVMRDTALLAAARTRGATAHPGHGMLYGQIVEIARSFGLTMAPGNVPRLFG